MQHAFSVSIQTTLLSSRASSKESRQQTNHHLNKIIVEGDSQIIIQLITKIIHGAHPLEVSPSWRLSGLLEEFGSLLQPNITIIPSHVKREANKVVDCLENEGVASTMELIHWNAQTSPYFKISQTMLGPGQ
jgi:hypothetical protein